MLIVTPTIEALKLRIQAELGMGMTDVELTDEQLNLSVQEALEEFREAASPATKEGFQFLNVTDNERFYPMPGYIIDITDVLRVGAGVVSGIEGLQYGAFIYQAMQTGQSFDLASYHFTTSFIESLNRLTAADPAFIFHSGLDGSQIGYGALSGSVETAAVPDTNVDTELDNRARLSGPILEFIHIPKNSSDTYLLNIRYSRTDAELINDAETGVFIHRYARACAKIILGHAYRKHDGMPGPGGGITLPGNELISEGKEEQLELKQDLTDLKYGEDAFGFLMG